MHKLGFFDPLLGHLELHLGIVPLQGWPLSLQSSLVIFPSWWFVEAAKVHSENFCPRRSTYCHACPLLVTATIPAVREVHNYQWLILFAGLLKALKYLYKRNYWLKIIWWITDNTPSDSAKGLVGHASARVLEVKEICANHILLRWGWTVTRQDHVSTC